MQKINEAKKLIKIAETLEVLHTHTHVVLKA